MLRQLFPWYVFLFTLAVWAFLFHFTLYMFFVLVNANPFFETVGDIFNQIEYLGVSIWSFILFLLIVLTQIPNNLAIEALVVTKWTVWFILLITTWYFFIVLRVKCIVYMSINDTNVFIKRTGNKRILTVKVLLQVNAVSCWITASKRGDVCSLHGFCIHLPKRYFCANNN